MLGNDKIMEDLAQGRDPVMTDQERLDFGEDVGQVLATALETRFTPDEMNEITNEARARDDGMGSSFVDILYDVIHDHMSDEEKDTLRDTESATETTSEDNPQFDFDDDGPAPSAKSVYMENYESAKEQYEEIKDKYNFNNIFTSIAKLELDVAAYEAKMPGSNGKIVSGGDIAMDVMRVLKGNLIDSLLEVGIRALFDKLYPGDQKDPVTKDNANDMRESNVDRRDAEYLTDRNGARDDGYIKDYESFKEKFEDENTLSTKIPVYGQFMGADMTRAPMERDGMKVWDTGKMDYQSVIKDGEIERLNIPSVRLVELHDNFYHVGPFGDVLAADTRYNSASVIEPGAHMRTFDISVRPENESKLESLAANKGMTIDELKASINEKAQEDFANKVEKSMEAHTPFVRQEIEYQKEELDYYKGNRDAISEYGDKLQIEKAALDDKANHGEFDIADDVREKEVIGKLDKIEDLKQEADKTLSIIETRIGKLEATLEGYERAGGMFNISETAEEKFVSAIRAETDAAGRVEMIDFMPSDKRLDLMELAHEARVEARLEKDPQDVSADQKESQIDNETKDADAVYENDSNKLEAKQEDPNNAGDQREQQVEAKDNKQEDLKEGQVADNNVDNNDDDRDMVDTDADNDDTLNEYYNENDGVDYDSKDDSVDPIDSFANDELEQISQDAVEEQIATENTTGAEEPSVELVEEDADSSAAIENNEIPDNVDDNLNQDTAMDDSENEPLDVNAETNADIDNDPDNMKNDDSDTAVTDGTDNAVSIEDNAPEIVSNDNADNVDAKADNLAESKPDKTDNENIVSPENNGNDAAKQDQNGAQIGVDNANNSDNNDNNAKIFASDSADNADAPFAVNDNADGQTTIQPNNDKLSDGADIDMLVQSQAMTSANTDKPETPDNDRVEHLVSNDNNENVSSIATDGTPDADMSDFYDKAYSACKESMENPWLFNFQTSFLDELTPEELDVYGSSDILKDAYATYIVTEGTGFDDEDAWHGDVLHNIASFCDGPELGNIEDIYDLMNEKGEDPRAIEQFSDGIADKVANAMQETLKLYSDDPDDMSIRIGDEAFHFKTGEGITNLDTGEKVPPESVIEQFADHIVNAFGEGPYQGLEAIVELGKDLEGLDSSSAQAEAAINIIDFAKDFASVTADAIKEMGSDYHTIEFYMDQDFDIDLAIELMEIIYPDTFNRETDLPDDPSKWGYTPDWGKIEDIPDTGIIGDANMDNPLDINEVDSDLDFQNDLDVIKDVMDDVSGPDQIDPSTADEAVEDIAAFLL